MEEELDSKLRISGGEEKGDPVGGGTAMQRTRSITFRAPQEQFTIHDFDLGKIYGVGSYSKVVRAKKLDTGKIYALKIMDKRFISKENKIEYVKLERIVLDQLEHPGIIQLFFTFQDTYSVYMALESCEGGELFDQITRKGRLPEEEARFYAAEVVDALEYIHSMGIIHRDIKPENLLLTLDGHIKIADFGTVKLTQQTKISVLADTSYEKACTFVGTAAYIPPEDSDPSKRPGAGPAGYATLKMHPFFRGIDWEKLRQSSAPKLVVDQNLDGEEDTQDGSWNLTHIGDAPSTQKGMQRGSSSTASSESQTHTNAISSIDSFDSKWQEFLDPGESIIMISKVKKLQKLTKKKVQLILTNRSKLICVDPSKWMTKASVVWSDDPNELTVHVSNSSHFKISTPKKSISFEDSKEQAWQWKKAIENFQTQRYC